MADLTAHELISGYREVRSYTIKWPSGRVQHNAGWESAARAVQNGATITTHVRRTTLRPHER